MMDRSARMLRLRSCAAAVIAVVIVGGLAGCGGADTSAESATSQRSGTAAGSATIADLMSAPVPSLCRHEPGKLVNGRLPLQNPMSGEVTIAERGNDRSPFVAFGDLTGDGVADGALVTACTAGGVGWPATVQLYTVGGKHLGGVDLGDVTHGREIVQNISISDQAVHVDWLTNGPDEAACCPSVKMSGDIRWNGSQVVIDNVRHAGALSSTVSSIAALYERDGSYYFISPSGKFQCGIILADRAAGGKAAAGCHGSTQPIPPRPASCNANVSWGRGMQVDTDGKVSFLCTGGLIYGPGSGTAPTSLEYGHPLSVNGFTCSTATTGVTCRNDSSGHGFTIADTMNRSF